MVKLVKDHTKKDSDLPVSSLKNKFKYFGLFILVLTQNFISSFLVLIINYMIPKYL